MATQYYDINVLKLQTGDRQILSTDQLSWQEKNRTFVAEISELKGFFPQLKTILLHNPKTGKCQEFRYYKSDMDASGEDTYGWRYLNKEGDLEILIIND